MLFRGRPLKRLRLVQKIEKNFGISIFSISIKPSAPWIKILVKKSIVARKFLEN